MLAVMVYLGVTWISQRDHLLIGLLYNTGARVSEITGVKVADVVLGGAACVHIYVGAQATSGSVVEIDGIGDTSWLRPNPQLGADAILLPSQYMP
jgi:integrase